MPTFRKSDLINAANTAIAGQADATAAHVPRRGEAVHHRPRGAQRAQPRGAHGTGQRAGLGVPGLIAFLDALEDEVVTTSALKAVGFTQLGALFKAAAQAAATFDKS